MSVDVATLLDLVDELAAQRPVAARLVTMTGDDAVGSKQLAEVLVADATLTARVMRLANSAYFGLGGRVGTVTFAVTVVGFTTVRSMAATAAAGVDTAEDLPKDCWTRGTTLAVAAGELSGSFGLPPADLFCLGLLTGIGQAILCQHDPTGYREMLAGEDVGGRGRAALAAAELERYGLAHAEVSAAALASWAFPAPMSQALHRLDQPGPAGTPSAACLRTAVEAVTRLLDPDVATRPVEEVSEGALTEDRFTGVLMRVRDTAARSPW